MTQSRNWLWTHLKSSVGVLFLVAASHTVEAQDTPYFVTYDHHMEEAGTLEIETFTTMGFPQGPEAGVPAERGQRFYAAPYVEIEYAVHDQWTTAFYLEGQGTRGDSTLFTGWRWENRYRPFRKATGGAQAEAARRMGLSRSALAYKLNKYGIRAAD